MAFCKENLTRANSLNSATDSRCHGISQNQWTFRLSTHPFSSACHPTDSRITTRIHPTSLISNISVSCMKAAIVCMKWGCPRNTMAPLWRSHLFRPARVAIPLVGNAHWAKQTFWQYYLPLLKKEFKGRLERVNLETIFIGRLTKWSLHFIRVEADEVTYPLHVILRFELEAALIDGSLKVKDVPEAWNTKMQELLGITPKNNTEGCLQDVHWSMGGVG